MRAHVVNNGVVVNTIEVDDLDFIPGLIDAAFGGSIGDLWDGRSFSPPVISTPVVPISITSRQGLIMLARAGLLASVRQALDLMEGQAGEEARIDFDHASEWRRDWPLLLAMAAQHGLTDAQVDQMFIDASAL